VLAQPVFNLIDFPPICFNRENKLKRFRIRGGELVTIEPQKFSHDRSRRPFIAADPRVILNQPEAERRSLPDEVCIFLKGGVLRAHERGFDQSAIIYSGVGLAEVAHDDDVD
jgi:hypothetical protein